MRRARGFVDFRGRLSPITHRLRFRLALMESLISADRISRIADGDSQICIYLFLISC